MPRIELFLLGFPSVEIDGKPIELGLRAGLGLFALIGDSSAPLSREKAATFLWPNADEVTSRNRLRRLLHKVRVKLGLDLIEADRYSLRFNPGLDIQIDTQRFTACCNAGEFDQAAQLYADDFLSGFTLSDNLDFEEWQFFRREAYRSQLQQALERQINLSFLAQNPAAALVCAKRLLAMDPLNEAAHRHVINACLKSGDRAAAERQLETCAKILDEELGVTLSVRTMKLLSNKPAPAPVEVPATHYTDVDGVFLAYQTIGQKKHDILLVPGFVSHVERVWEDRRCRECIEALSGIGRVIIFDRRGIGLSDRPDEPPSEEATAKDILAVLNAVDSRQAILFGASEGGPGCIRFAHDHPGRVKGLLLWGSMAKGCATKEYPYALTSDQYAHWINRLISDWGGPAELPTFAPSLVGDRQVEHWWASLLRSASSPGAVKRVIQALRDTDVRSLLPAISVPTTVLHRKGDRAVHIAAGKFMAGQIPDAKFIGLEGDDHWFWAGDLRPLIKAVADLIAE